jgi:hypothetical protein
VQAQVEQGGGYRRASGDVPHDSYIFVEFHRPTRLFSSRCKKHWKIRKPRLQFIRPGKPVENAHMESLYGRLREECLNQHAFASLHDARKRIEAA